MNSENSIKTKFIQIHFLTSYPGTLLNRDDAGLAKRLTFGGVTRTRISSQCLKRHWRTFNGKMSLRELDCPESFRSRYTFELMIRQPLIKEGLSQDLVDTAVQTLMAEIIGESKKAKDAKKAKNSNPQTIEESSKETLKTSQITILGRPEVDYLLKIARETIKGVNDEKELEKKIENRLKKEVENLKALKVATGIDAALFGRMVTGDILARGDAAIHVAHAFTVHAEASETDYFSAMDDLQKEIEGEQLGAGHINTTELTSGLYYGYVVVDVPLLVSNLEGCKAIDWQNADHKLAQQVIKNLIHIIATVSPGAKLGSTAPYGYAQTILIEKGDAQPRTLANAFLKPVKEFPDLLYNTMEALETHVKAYNTMYGKCFESSYASIADMKEWPSLGNKLPLAKLANWAADLPEKGNTNG